MSRRLIPDGSLTKKESGYLLLKGYGPAAEDYAFQAENCKTGAGVLVLVDRPLAKPAFWINSANSSLEPLIRQYLVPGEATIWTITYDFYGLNPRRFRKLHPPILRCSLE